MKIIIFGANGMLGTYLTKVLSVKYNVVPLTRENIDVTKTSEKEIFNFLENNVSKGDVIINASGIIKQREYDICDMIIVNSLFPNYLAKFKKISNCEVIHITTDCVFNGLIGNYTEDDKHDCYDEYGKTKSLGENDEITTIRTSIIGEELKNQKSLVEWVKTQSNKEIFGYTNHLWNGITCLELSKFIDIIVSTNNFWKGVNHIFSPTTVSKYELVNFINEIYDLNILVTPKETDEKCFRNLSTKFVNPIKKELFLQIKEMKNFKLK